MSDPKTCANPNCGKTFTRGTRSGSNSKARFETQTYCTYECKVESSRLRREQESPPKTCANDSCGKTFSRKPRESRNDFMRRSYCCFTCAHQRRGANRRVLPRKATPELVEVVREPGQPWRPSGWTQKPNVYAGARQGC